MSNDTQKQESQEFQEKDNEAQKFSWTGLETPIKVNRTSHLGSNRKLLTNTKSTSTSPLLSSLRFHLRTLWLFTVSEHSTIVYPWTAFGIFSALAGPALTTNEAPVLWEILFRFPQTLLWMWMNILAFTISNQRLPNSVLEDSVNKPWRPLPSGRITQLQARRLLLAVLPATFFLNMSLGGFEVTLIALVLTWMYNDLGGADENYIVRNLINSCGLVSWSAGTTLVACGNSKYALNTMGYKWLAIEAAIIFTTLHVQDLRDQEGDRVRDRKTAPIVWGDAATRWTIAVPVMIWSLLCPMIWNLGVTGFLVPLLPGGTLAFRVMLLRTVAADKITWKLWGIWIASLFVLPLISSPSVLYALNSTRGDLRFPHVLTNSSFEQGLLF
ncbi:hypothetical protein MMC34_004361 [Xylographa carneopallida]|nr:hypothetical protein [Xylographa carneopallida]